MARQLLIWLCAFACCLQLSLQEWAIDDSGCIAPDNAAGDCIDIYECAPIIGWLDLHVKRKKVVSGHLKDVLRKYVCGIGKVTKVCCPRVVETVNPLPILPTDITTTIINPGPIWTPDVTPTSVVNPGPIAPPDVGCMTPDNAVGDCVYIYDCKSIMSLLELHGKRNKVVSERLKITLEKSVCAVGKVTKVCCPRIQTPKTVVKPGPISTSTPTLTDPDVTPTPVANPPDVTRRPIVNSVPTLTPLELTPTAGVTPGLTLTPPDVTATPRLTPDPILTDLVMQIGGRHLLPLDSCGLFGEDNRIFGGEMANLFEFPWMALLAFETSNGTEYKCGGSLINDRYVLTAAHCFDELKLAHVRLGEFDLRNSTDCDTSLGCAGPTEDILAEEIIVHPGYNSTYFRNDIGLIRLQRNIERKDHISPICLPIDPELRKKPFRNVVLSGWGITEESRPSDVLRKADVVMVDQRECRRRLRRGNAPVTDNHMCTGGIGRKGSCPGDSGGPIQLKQVYKTDVRYVQRGVISAGVCGGLDIPGIHTRVDRYLDWIINTIKP